MNVGDLNKVWEIKALKKPGQDEAKKILEQIAKQVQPIMHKHKWRVKVLSEFCPSNPRLLGLNVGGGVHVKLRLRRPNRDWDFFPFNQVLDTMLHELCHNAHGPHNASFYKLWDELRKECEELMAKGLTGTGQGFDLPGRRLGGFARQPALSSLHQTALAAAEKRARLASLLPSGPKRLGGDGTIMAALSPVQAAAMAAERRLQDEIWCGSQSHSTENDDVDNNSILPPSNGASRKRSHDSDLQPSFNSSDIPSNSNSIDFSADASRLNSISETEARFLKRSCQSMPNAHSQSGHVPGVSFVDLSDPSSSKSVLSNSTINNSEELEMWECTTCTLLNRPLAPVCEVCGSQKPKDVTTKYGFWSCKFCTMENCVMLDKCSACDQWRYSRGPPSATYAPYLGT